METVNGLLVQYSDSSEGEADSETEECERKEKSTELSEKEDEKVDDTGEKLGSPTRKKRRVRLELPSNIRSMFSDSKSNEEVNDNPDDHQGRERSFAHVRGNWATHIYFPMEKSPVMENLTEELISQLPKSGSWYKMESLHMSVSRTVTVRHHTIEPLTADLREAMLKVPEFRYKFDSVKLYVNDEKTRTFLGLCVCVGEHDLKRVVQQVDDVFKDYRLEKYYEDPSFHISIAWAHGDLKHFQGESEVQQDLQLVMDRYLKDCLSHFNAEKAVVKCGNKFFALPLKPESKTVCSRNKGPYT